MGTLYSFLFFLAFGMLEIDAFTSLLTSRALFHNGKFRFFCLWNRITKANITQALLFTFVQRMREGYFFKARHKVEGGKERKNNCE